MIYNRISFNLIVIALTLLTALALILGKLDKVHEIEATMDVEIPNRNIHIKGVARINSYSDRDTRQNNIYQKTL